MDVKPLSLSLSLSLSPGKERRLRVAEKVLRRIDVPKERK
jgi:hypothetical protein